jgi:hypothetical protein
MGIAKAASVRCEVQTLEKRTPPSSRAMGRVICTRHPKRLNELHEEWFKDYRMRGLVLPTDRLDYIEGVVDPADLFRKSERFL